MVSIGHICATMERLGLLKRGLNDREAPHQPFNDQSGPRNPPRVARNSKESKVPRNILVIKSRSQVSQLS